MSFATSAFRSGGIVRPVLSDECGNVNNRNLSLGQPCRDAPLVAGVNASATLTPAQLSPSTVITSTPTANATLTTPTAAALCAALPHLASGRAYEFTIANLAAATYSVTVAAGTGVTMVGNAAVAAASSGTFLVLMTANTPTVSIIRM